MTTATLTSNSDITPNGATWNGMGSGPFYPGLSDGSNLTYWDDSSSLIYVFGLGISSGSIGSTVSGISTSISCTSDNNDGSNFSITIRDGGSNMLASGTVTPTSFGGPPAHWGSATGGLTLTAWGLVGSHWTSMTVTISDSCVTGDLYCADLTFSVTSTSGGGPGEGGGGPVGGGAHGSGLVGASTPPFTIQTAVQQAATW